MILKWCILLSALIHTTYAVNFGVYGKFFGLSKFMLYDESFNLKKRKFPIFSIVAHTKSHLLPEHTFKMNDRPAGMTLGRIDVSNGDVWRV